MREMSKPIDRARNAFRAHNALAKPQSARSNRFGRGFSNFRRDKKGGVAIEFALLAVPFLALLAATLETALLFVGGQVLDRGVTETARMIRTGEAQQSEFERADFARATCAAMVVMVSCKDRLTIDVRTASSFSSANLGTPVVNGKLDSDDFTYEPGNGSDIVVVRAFFEWPTFLKAFGPDYSTLENGNHLLMATATFRNEPFP